jgi:hypothetical protein
MSSVTHFHFAHGARWVLDPVHGWIAAPRPRGRIFIGFTRTGRAKFVRAR